MVGHLARTRCVCFVIILTSTVCFALACSQNDNKSAPTPVITTTPSTSLPMPPIDSVELAWTLSDGKRVNLSDQRGQVVVLDLYATWCQPCRESIPHLIDLHERFKGKGLSLVGLNVGGPDDRVKVADFARQLHITYPLGFPDKALTDLLIADDNRIPQTFVFSRSGQLIKRYIGYDESIPKQLEQLIQSELAVSSK